MIRVLTLTARVAVAVPIVVGRAIHDEIMWRRISSRQPSEPGMREWIADTLESVARFGK